MNTRPPPEPSAAGQPFGRARGNTFALKTDGTVAPVQRDLSSVAATLQGWLHGKLPDASDLQISNLSYPQGAGLSNETILFDASWRGPRGPESRGMVVRIEPSLNRVNYEVDFQHQFAVMQVLHESGLIPVAQPLWFEPDVGSFGHRFFVLEKKHGRVPVSFPPYSAQGWLKDATPAQRARAWSSGVRALAALHFVPVENVAFLNRPQRGPTGLEQEIEYWRRFYLWARGERHTPLMDDTFAWLLAHIPAGRPTAFSWGDARIGNMMFGDDFELVTVMDWEQASLGGSLLDLAWWLILDATGTERSGIARLEGMGGREETIALWQSITGADVSDLHWYEVFALFRLSVFVMRMLTLDGSARESFNFGDNPATRFLADHLGVERPTAVY